MAKVTYLGFQKEPDEGSQKAYEILTGRNLKPFYKVFSTPQKARPEQKPGKLRKPFQQVQHNCNKLFSNTFCYCSNTLQMLVGRRGLEPRTT